MIRASVVDQADRLREQFRAAQPFRYAVIDDFLDTAFFARLMAEFPSFDAQKAVNELGQQGRKAVVSNIAAISPAYREFDALIRSRDFLALMEKITSIDGLRYDPDYVGGGTHENLDGQDLDPHVDFNYHPTRHTHRRLNLILFLNPEWSEEWGGCLELFRDPWAPGAEQSASVVPLANRAVIFETTESSWHGFRRIRLPEEKQHLSRRSIAVYFYTNERPSEETSAPHGTVYVPRPLPAQLEAGHTLTPDEVHELEVLVARRDAQIRYLYEREREFSAVMQATTESLSFRLGRALTWPLRKLLR